MMPIGHGSVRNANTEIIPMIGAMRNISRNMNSPCLIPRERGDGVPGWAEASGTPPNFRSSAVPVSK